ncbi:HlyD family efflux transporter periplasmic adaptor subunit [Aliiglaciecola sp. LCG003]|uniref:HlyD family secretion protein n=1 Tax=Aliiglaciecola sp. LCG003 TaxID=3053655 RepID=UPI0025748BBE|nr:HlyD family efflux transporter periplasmic adaptor subunit [Aliiglaciecola sp. LCG003]WJG11199.1 HlyD family efflux transporter periplasmic adaptor subunit [Aliiglaciecola sp. LCG003]
MTMGKSLFRSEAVEYQKQTTWGDLVLYHPSSLSILTYLILFVVLLLIIVLCLGTYEQRTVVGGYLVPTEGLVKVYPQGEGIISEIHIADDDIVKAGDRLMTVSTVRSSEALSDIDSAVMGQLTQSQSHLEEKIYAEQRLAEIAKSRLSSIITGLQHEILQLETQYETANSQYQAAFKRASEIKSLINSGHVSGSQYQDQYENLLVHKLSMQEIEAMLIKQNNLLNDAKIQVSQLPFLLTSKLADLKQSISTIKQKYIDLDAKRSYTILAPTAGRVTALQKEIGRVLSPQKMLMAILPEKAIFEADLFVPTHSIGFIRSDQKVNLRYKAFPYQRFGIYSGKISKITNIILSPNEINGPMSIHEPVYRVTVKLDSQSVNAYGNQLKLQSGMLLDADIILDELSVVDWLLDPLFRVTGRS